MFERIANAAFEKNQEGLIMMASPPDSIVDAEKTVGNEDKQVEVSFKREVSMLKEAKDETVQQYIDAKNGQSNHIMITISVTIIIIVLM